MNITVNGRHMEITDALRSYATEKVAKLDKYLPSGAEAVVTFNVEKYRHKAEVQIKVNGIVIQAQEETEGMYASIDQVLDKLERQVKKYKEKLKNHKVKGEEKAAAAAAEPESDLDRIPEIIKTKKFDMKPMTSDEAVMQMELLDKDFFVFSNVATGALSVIYKRRDGNVGLIEPA
ncbi:MAG: ribosome-associated translation inhibitor RaiA [Nitrospirae bacterium]|nr:ribosome-associated translation inhibitor RaiA [Nitrospirota bacterium]MBI5696215.1 ribosome-associated translation inhibitor RaiA [Nitrospirota bacterium]